MYPDLDSGLVYIQQNTSSPEPLYQLVIDQLRERRGGVWWLDARNTAVTTALYEIAESPEWLASIQLARAFTAYQHHALVRELPKEMSSQTAFAVVPNVIDLYRDDDVPEYETGKLVNSTLSILANLGESLEIPVITTTIRDDNFVSKVMEHSSQVIECCDTGMGFMFKSDDFETELYWKDGYIQTTIPYWVQLVGRAEAKYETPHQTPAVGLTV